MRAVVLAGLVLVSACKKKEVVAVAPPPAPKVKVEAPPPAPLTPLGLLDPWARPGTEAQANLKKANKALRAKKWDDARAGFEAALAAAPDSLAGRWGLVRALALGGGAADLPAAWEQLLVRDYVGFATRLDKPKEFAALRAGPTWTKLTETRDEVRERWSAALPRGFFLVARVHPAVEPKMEGGVTEAPLDLKQEIYRYDPDDKRFLRVSDTDGHAFAIHVAPDNKSLAFVVAPRLYRAEGLDAFVDPRLGLLTFDELATTGPFLVMGHYTSITLGRESNGHPLFVLVDADNKTERYTIDAAGTALTKLEEGELSGAQTIALPYQIAHDDGQAPEGVTLTEGDKQFTLEGVAKPIVATRPLLRSSLHWSPNKLRITYTGVLDACKIMKSGSKEKNELYVFEAETQRAVRVGSALSLFGSQWLDEDRLVFENGVGKDGRLVVYSFTTHSGQPLPTRHGAGLWGVPTLACEVAEAADGDEEPAAN